MGELDVPGFRVMAETIAAGIPGARLHVVADAGHMVPMEAPVAVSEIVVDLVGSVRGTTPDDAASDDLAG